MWLPTVAHCYEEFKYFTWQEIYEYAEYVVNTVPYVERLLKHFTDIRDYEEVKLLWSKGWYKDNLKRKDRILTNNGIL